MNKEDVRKLLQRVKDNEIEVEAAIGIIEDLSYKELGFAKIDNHREIRVGYPEVIYCEGKTVEQVKSIVQFMLTKDNNILGTWANEKMYEAVKSICPEAKYNPLGRTITIQKREGNLTDSYIAVPTSIGYGASFGGLSALLSMLNSCASGISVVNIDNGFGPAYNASIINKL